MVSSTLGAGAKLALLGGLVCGLLMNYFMSDAFWLGSSFGSRGLSERGFQELLCDGEEEREGCLSRVGFAVTVANAKCSLEERDSWVCKESQELMKTYGEKGGGKKACKEEETRMRECTDTVIASELYGRGFSEDRLRKTLWPGAVDAAIKGRDDDGSDVGPKIDFGNKPER